MTYNVYRIRDLASRTQNLRETKLGWVPARPIRYHSLWNDLKLAWMVFTRKADVLVWDDNQ